MAPPDAILLETFLEALRPKLFFFFGVISFSDVGVLGTVISSTVVLTSLLTMSFCGVLSFFFDFFGDKILNIFFGVFLPPLFGVLLEVVALSSLLEVTSSGCVRSFFFDFFFGDKRGILKRFFTYVGLTGFWSQGKRMRKPRSRLGPMKRKLISF